MLNQQALYHDETGSGYVRARVDVLETALEGVFRADSTLLLVIKEYIISTFKLFLTKITRRKTTHYKDNQPANSTIKK